MEKEQIEHRAQKAINDLQLLQMDHSKLMQSQGERVVNT
jgi:FtsZ-binding cell division protein ZapB